VALKPFQKTFYNLHPQNYSHAGHIPASLSLERAGIQGQRKPNRTLYIAGNGASYL
jgi:hypothetical protein